jgi:hypothetical protein
MSSADGGLEVKAELLEWLKYFGCCWANAWADGEGMEMAGEGVKMLESN